MSSSNRLFANTTYVYLGEVALKASGFLLTVLVARWLGGEELGKWAVALSALMIVGTLLDLGVNTFSVRELTVGRMNPSALATWNSLLKLWGGLGSLILLSLLISVGWVPWELIGLVIPLFIAGLLQAFGSIYATFLRAREEMVYEGLLKIFHASSQAFFGYLLFKSGLGLQALAWLILLIAIATLFSYVFLNHRKRFLFFQWPNYLIPNLDALCRCLPFTFLLFFGVIYFRIDILILRFFWDNQTVGEYAAAYRLLEGILLLPWAFSSVFYPYLGRVASHSASLFRDTIGMGLKYACVLGLPIALLGFFLARPLIFTIYGPPYEVSVPILQVLVFSVPVIFLSAVTSTTINTGLSPTVNAWIALAMVVENISLNLWAVPRWGGLGASWTTLATELSGLVMGIVYIWQKLFPLPIFSFFLRTLAAALSAALFALFFPWIWMAPVYVLFYGFALWIMGLIQSEDRKIVGDAP